MRREERELESCAWNHTDDLLQVIGSVLLQALTTDSSPEVTAEVSRSTAAELCVTRAALLFLIHCLLSVSALRWLPGSRRATP